MNAEQTTTSDSETVEPSRWVEEYGDYLYRYAYSRLRDSNAAEEVVQETFLAGIRFEHQYSGKGSQRGWLLAILRRKIVDYVRTRARKSHAQLAEDETDPTNLLFDETGHWKKDSISWLSEPSHKAESKELWDVVRGCLKELPQGQADVFMLSVFEQLDTAEICKELDISESNLWVRLHRARLKLANCVGSKWN